MPAARHCIRHQQVACDARDKHEGISCRQHDHAHSYTQGGGSAHLENSEDLGKLLQDVRAAAGLTVQLEAGHAAADGPRRNAHLQEQSMGSHQWPMDT